MAEPLRPEEVDVFSRDGRDAISAQVDPAAEHVRQAARLVEAALEMLPAGAAERQARQLHEASEALAGAAWRLEDVGRYFAPLAAPKRRFPWLF